MERPAWPRSQAELIQRQDQLADWIENHDPDFSESPPPITIPAGPDFRIRARAAAEALRADLELGDDVPIQVRIQPSTPESRRAALEQFIGAPGEDSL